MYVYNYIRVGVILSAVKSLMRVCEELALFI